jgi:hypothetical protein
MNADPRLVGAMLRSDFYKTTMTSTFRALTSANSRCNAGRSVEPPE